MIFVCDEGVDRSIVEQLRADGHNVTYIAEISPSIPDDEVLSEANDRGAVLVTADKDFGELVFRLGRLATGIFLIRLHDIPTDERATLVGALPRAWRGAHRRLFRAIADQVADPKTGLTALCPMWRSCGAG